MVDKLVHPCAKGLTPECFAASPQYARQLFTYRLLTLFLPPDLSAKILEFLGIEPPEPPEGVPVTLPPASPTEPTTESTAEPTAEPTTEPTPEPTTEPTPEPPLSPDPPYVPPYPPITPDVPGPPNPPTSSPPVDPWFYDDFTNLDLTIWEKWLDGSSAITAGSGWASFVSTGTDYCILRTAPNLAMPDPFIFTIRLRIATHQDSNPNFYIAIYTGSYQFKIRLNPPTSIWHSIGGGGIENIVDDYSNTWVTLKLHADGQTTRLFLDNTLLSTQPLASPYTGYPGRISLDNNNYIHTYVDYVSVIPD